MNDYRHILESLKAGVIYADNDHVIRYMDKEAIKRFAKSGGANLVGKNLMDCHNEMSAKKIQEYIQQMKENKLEEVQVRSGKMGHSYMTAVRDDGGNLIGYLERFERVKEVKEPKLRENLYQKSAWVYDELTSLKRKPAEIQFYKDLIPVGASVLELGIGTGRIGLELAKRGNHVVGIDMSHEMLTVLRHKISEEFKEIKGDLRIFEGDMSTFDLESRFDAVILPYRAFLLLLSDKQRDQCLQAVKKHLNPHGIIVIDIFDPDLSTYQNWSGKVLDEDVIELNGIGGTVKRRVIGDRHFDKQQIISFHYAFEVQRQDMESVQYSEPMRIAYLKKEQALEVFHRNGLILQALYSDFDHSEVRENRKKELVFVLKGE